MKRLLILLAVWVCGFLSVVEAGTVWDGGGDTASWGNPTNWSGNALPPFNGLDSILFGSGFGSGTINYLDGNRMISNLFVNTATDFTISRGTPSDSTLTLMGGNITCSSAVANVTINPDIILGKSGTISAGGIGSSVITINGSISDGGNGYGLTKSGSRQLTLNGSNSFGGGVVLSLGILAIQNTNALGTGSLRVTGASSVFRSNSRAITNNIEFDTASVITFGGAAGNGLTVNAPGKGMLKTNVTINCTQTDGDYLTFNNGIGESIGNCSLSVYGSRDFALRGDSTFSGTLNLGTVSGSSRFLAGGALVSTNVVFNQGLLRLAVHNGLGSGNLTINGYGLGCTFDSLGARRDLDNEIEMKGALVGISSGSFGCDYNRNGGACTLIGNTTFDFANLPTTTHAPRFWNGIGERGGSYGLSLIDGTSTRYLMLSGTSTYTGPTVVNAAVLRLMSANALPTNTLLSVGAGGNVELNGFNTQVGSLAGGGPITLGAGTLSIVGFTNTAFAGFITGTGGLIREGTGIQAFSSVSNLTYSGVTQVRGGTLRILGRLSASGTAKVYVSGGLLDGTGTVARSVNVLEGGSIAGGAGTNAPGLLTFTGTLTLSNNAAVVWSATPSAASELAVTNLTQESAVTVKVMNSGRSIQSSESFPLIRYSGTLTGFNASAWTVDVSESPTATASRNGRVYAVNNIVYLTGLQSPTSPGTLILMR